MFGDNWRTVSLALLLILVAAVIFRFWKLDELPPGFYHDEAYNGLDALSLVRGESFPKFYEGWELYAADAHADRPPHETRFPLFFEGNYGREPLHIYLMALSIALLGATPFAIRAVPAVAGVLAVLTTFFAARALFSNRTFLLPLLAAFTLAVLYPAVHFSRFGIRAMVFVPIETLAVACFWWGVNRGGNQAKLKKGKGSWVWFLAAGVLLGLSLYTFAAARLFPLVWVLFVPLWFLLDHSAINRYWRNLAAMVTAAILTSLPILFFFSQYPYFFVFRIAYVANKGKGVVEGKPWMTWILNAGRVGRGLFYLGETHLRHNLPGRPYFDFLQAGFFILGVIRAMRSVLQPRFVFLLLWFGVMLLPSILSGDAPHFGRLSGAAVPASILVALGAEWFTSKISKRLQRRYTPQKSNTAAVGFIIALFFISAIWAGIDYFGRYASLPDLKDDFYQSDWDLGLFAAGYSETADVYLSPSREELATILFALKDPDRLRNYNASSSLIPTGRAGKDLLYLIREGDNESLDQLQRVFVDGILEEVEDGFVPFYVSADTPRNPTDFQMNFVFDEQIKLVGWSKRIDENQLLVTLAWQAEMRLEKNYTAFVHVLDEDGKLVAQLDREPAGYPTSDWRSGEIVVDQFSILLPDEHSPDRISIQTGFYYLPTLERLGGTAVLDEAS